MSQAIGKRQTMFAADPSDLVIVGLDTDDDKTHYLYDPRIALPLDEGLVANILEYGVLEPVLCNADRQVIDGRQRTRAAREANARLVKEGKEPLLISVILKKGEEGRLFGMSQATFIRQDESILAKAAKVARYMDLGYTEDDAAVTFGVTKTAIKQWLALLDAPAAVRKAAETGEISQSAAVKLAKLPPGEAADAIADMKASGQRTATAAQARAAKAKNGEDGPRALPSLPKRKIQRLVLAANRLGHTDPLVEALADGLGDMTGVEAFLLGMRVACGDRAHTSVKGLAALLDEATS